MLNRRPATEMNPLELAALFELDEHAFRQRFRKTPLWRAQRRGLLRSAAIVLGNAPTAQGVGALRRGLDDDEALVRAASAWALGNHKGLAVETALRARQAVESDAEVRREIVDALMKHVPRRS